MYVCVCVCVCVRVCAFAQVEYLAGAFGYMFEFALVFDVEPHSLVRFEVPTLRLYGLISLVV